jgi:molecular chaperone Hsp33
VGLGVFADASGITAAGGFLVQSMPPSDEAVIETLVRHIEKMPPITELLLEGTTPEEIIDRIFQGIPVDVLEKRELAFRCNCSRDRLSRALISLGREELKTLVEKQTPVELTCEFCRKPYAFDVESIQGMIESLSRA